MFNETSSSANIWLTRVEFQHLFESPDTGMLSIDSSGCVVGMNDFFNSLLLYPKEDTAGKGLWEFGRPSNRDADRLAVDSLRRLGHLRNVDFPLRTSDGFYIHLEFRRLGRLPDETDLFECQFRELVAGTPIPRLVRTPTEDGRPRILPLHQFEQIVSREIEYTRAHSRPLSLLSVRADCPQRLLDDRVSSRASAYRKFVRACSCGLRQTDIVGRVGDTEFVALLPGASAKGALDAAERLRGAAAAMEASALPGLEQPVTVSIGVVTTRTGGLPYPALRLRADTRRDDATLRGGNRVDA